MISSVPVQRVSTAMVAVEHPDGWTAAEVDAAVQTRAIDIGSTAMMWCAESRTTLGKVLYQQDERPEPTSETEGPEMEYAILELTEDDLS